VTARSRHLVLALAVIASAGCATYVGGAQPIDPSRLATEPGWIRAEATPAIRQTTLEGCGAAALAMVAGRWHVPLSADDPALRPTSRGLRLGQLRSAARAHGLIAFAITADRATLEHELRAGRPVIIGLLRPYSRSEALSHFEVVVALRRDEFVTLDPAAGLTVRTWAALQAEWAPAHYPALVILGASRS
jgi:ABC-type bacteriocin/lantibiotic exporter with double-glycine peptidase domain